MKPYLYLTTLLFLAACSGLSNKKSLYEVKMMSGETLYTPQQPKLEEGFYHFDDVNKQRYLVKENLVLYIEAVEVKR
ncbi:MAG: hypothetical protein Q4B71_03105 [Cardiobacteriaceae bacterium]|nr:hypothetical protein [Cardiobacteriaceae bacterium]